MKKLTRSLLALALCGAMVITLFCGCSRESIPIFGKLFIPSFTVVGQVPYETPAVDGVSWAEDANIAINRGIIPLINLLREANAEREVARLEYSFDETDDGYAIKIYISNDVGGRIYAGQFRIDKKGVVTPPGNYPDFINDGDYLNGLLRLQRYGMTITEPSPSDAPTQNELLRLCIEYYETVTEAETDTSVLRWTHEDELFTKAVALGLVNNDYEIFSYGYDEEISNSTLSLYMSTITRRLLTDHYGRSSTVVSLSDLTEAVEVFMHLYDSETFFDWSSVISACKNTDLSAVETPEEITRLDAAVVFCSMFESVFGAGSLEKPEYDEFVDYPSDIAKTASYNLLMNYFPTYGLFSEDYIIHGDQLGEIANHFVWNLFWHCTEKYGDYWSDANTTPPISYRDITAAFGWLDRIFDDIPLPDGEAVIADNSRNYEWYFSQFNTGEYSDINCMPTISSMAIKWYYPDSAVKVEELRNMYLEDNDDGWYMSQVISALEEYNVPCEYVLMEEHSLTELLDKGHIVLSQMSEGDLNYSGHCFVIYGYRKLGDSIQYMIHDPGIYDGVDDFGKEPGRDMLLDSRYVHYIIYRFTDCYVAVG